MIGSEFVWWICQWIFFALVWGIMAWKLIAERDKGRNFRRESLLNQHRLFEACLRLRAAKNGMGFRLDPYTENLVERTLGKCPNSNFSLEHDLDASGYCKDCKIKIKN